MPYDLRSSGSAWEVYNTETGETVPGGRHSGKEKALAHLRALAANVEHSEEELWTIREI